MNDVRPVIDPVSAIALLEEPTRRRLYDLVAANDGAVGRDDAAGALGISRELAAFHLDRLAAAGLLETMFRRRSDRRGPGAGRPAKLYRRVQQELTVSLPPRDYERAAEILSEALSRPKGQSAREAVANVARARGREAGAEARKSAGRRPSQRRLERALLDLLQESGYEPRVDAETRSVRLRNCPYHALVERNRDLTCGMNLAWAQGIVDGLGNPTVGAELAPQAGYCCVVFDVRSKQRSGGSATARELKPATENEMAGGRVTRSRPRGKPGRSG